MSTVSRNNRSTGLVVRASAAIVATIVLISEPSVVQTNVSAHTGPVFGPACGAASIDGVVNAAEWAGASRKTVQMYSPSGADPFTLTLYVMNGANYLYLGLTIDDDEFSTHAKWLDQGDTWRADFDNDHSGSLFAVGDDALLLYAAPPQFKDHHIYFPGSVSCRLDSEFGGTSDGSGAASRVGGLNHFELRHPLCSSDSLDFCLLPADTVGFQLEYLDAQADGSYGGTQFFPGSDSTAEADIVIAQCAAGGSSIYLPLVQRLSS